jgi:hypothetical protein
MNDYVFRWMTDCLFSVEKNFLLLSLSCCSFFFPVIFEKSVVHYICSITKLRWF